MLSLRVELSVSVQDERSLSATMTEVSGDPVGLSYQTLPWSPYRGPSVVTSGAILRHQMAVERQERLE